MSNEERYGAMRVVDLRNELRVRGAPTAGLKAQLVARLVLLDKASEKSRPSAARQLVLEPDNEDTPASSPSSPAPSGGVGCAWSPEHLSKAAPSEAPMEVDNAVFSPPAALTPKRSTFSDSNAAARPSCLSTPKNSPKKARVSFGSVEMRKYGISHGGSLSTPSQGAYPIGLSWDVKEEVAMPLSEFEKGKSPGAPTNASPRRLGERDRKLLLEKVDRRSYFEKQASYETEREELAQLRRARQQVDCGCTAANSCGTSRCLCFKEGVPCNDDSCQCSCDTCINPMRNNFDEERVRRYRMERIQEAPYTNENSPTHIVQL